MRNRSPYWAPFVCALVPVALAAAQPASPAARQAGQASQGPPQAITLEVLVPADAGIAELVEKGISAELYEFGLDGLTSAIERLLDDPLHAARIGSAGREAMIARWESAPFSHLWKSMVQ